MAETYDPADQTVDEVLEHVEGMSYGELTLLIDAERNGKARSTLLGSLERIAAEMTGEVGDGTPELAETAAEVGDGLVRAGGHVLTERGWEIEDL